MWARELSTGETVIPRMGETVIPSRPKTGETVTPSYSILPVVVPIVASPTTVDNFKALKSFAQTVGADEWKRGLLFELLDAEQRWSMPLQAQGFQTV